MSEWQPMDTAPKGGQKIICWCGDYVDLCWYEYKYKIGMVWMTASCIDFGGYETPTHWMPLPNPPGEVSK